MKALRSTCRILMVSSLLVVAVITACSDDDENPVVPNRGSIRISVATTGVDLDPDGYSVVLDGGTRRGVSLNDTIFFSEVSVGNHGVLLDGVAVNGTVAGINPRAVTVTNGETTATHFDVACVAALFDRIAFSSNRDGGFEIYVMTITGGGLANLTNDAGDDYTPAWSPDGTKIAFDTDRDGNREA